MMWLCATSFISLVRPRNRKTDLDTGQKLGFGSVSPKKRGFGFITDPGQLAFEET